MWPGQAARSRVAAQREGRGNWYGAPRWGAQHKYGTTWLGGSFTVFVDGFGELVTEAKLRGAFARDGKVQDVEIQPRRRGDSRFKFGFVHYATDAEAWCTIRLLNGLRFEGNFLQVHKERYQRLPHRHDNDNSSTKKYAIRGRVWRVKKP